MEEESYTLCCYHFSLTPSGILHSSRLKRDKSLSQSTQITRCICHKFVKFFLSQGFTSHSSQTLLTLLRSDLAWWERKFIFQPHLEADENIGTILMQLKTRINSYESLLTGGITEEFVTLTPYSEKSDFVIYE